MKREADVGRVLVASLHQAIADVLPARLAFYEDYLSADGFREGSIGLAPLLAVLSFLRQEGAAYDEVTGRAGTYAASWTIDGMPSFRRSVLRALPLWLRLRLVLREARRLVRNSQPGTRTMIRVSRGAARVEVRGSVFCGVRERVSQPLCGFYAAAFAHLLARFEVPRDVRVAECQGTGERACRFEVVRTS